MIKQLTAEEHAELDSIKEDEIAEIQAAQEKANKLRTLLLGYDPQGAVPFVTSEHVLYSEDDQRRLSDELLSMSMKARTGYVSPGPDANDVILSEGAKEGLSL